MSDLLSKPIIASLLVFIGSGCGGVCRLWIALHVDRWLSRTHGVPWGTVAVNIVGSLLLGIVFYTFKESPWKLLVGTGFLGGFTTFSTFSQQSWHLLNNGSYVLAATKIGVTVLGCLLATMIGWWLASLLKPAV